MSHNPVRTALIAVAAELLAAVIWAICRFRSDRRAGRVPFEGLRRTVNRRLNPALVHRGLAGGRHSEIAVLEHVGRKSGISRVTPVHPTFVDGAVWIPVPYGESSQWVQNVLAAGSCRVWLHGSAYLLDTPALVPAVESPNVPRFAARALDRLGMRYLRMRLAGSGSAIGPRTVPQVPAVAA